MTDLLLIGGGGHCRSCIDVIEIKVEFGIRGIIKPLSDGVDGAFGYPILGSDDDLPALLKETPYALVTVGQIKSPETRIRLYEMLKKLGAKLVKIVSPLAYCSERASINEGTIMMHFSSVNAGADVGANCIINSYALIEHDVKIADHCHISTGVRIDGGAIIGKGTFIGSGTIIKENILIGENVVISAGQLILEDVPDGTVVINGQ